MAQGFTDTEVLTCKPPSARLSSPSPRYRPPHSLLGTHSSHTHSYRAPLHQVLSGPRPIPAVTKRRKVPALSAPVPFHRPQTAMGRLLLRRPTALRPQDGSMTTSFSQVQKRSLKVNGWQLTRNLLPQPCPPPSSLQYRCQRPSHILVAPR